MIKPNHITFNPFMLIAGLTLAVASCNRATEPEKSVAIAAKDTANLDEVFTTGKRLINAKSDSLLPLSQKLRKIYAISGNKKVLVYAGVFESTYHWMSGDHKQAMTIAMQALANAEKYHQPKALPDIYSILANVHKENANYKQAFADAAKGLEAARQNRDTAAIISMLGLRAMFTHSYYLKQSQPQNDHTSLAMQFEALQIAGNNPKYERLTIRFYNNIAQAFKDQKNYTQAITYANKAVQLAIKYDQQRSLTYSYCWLGESYYFMGNHSKGMSYLNQALDITRKLNQPFRQMEVYESMYDCYKTTGDYPAAIKSLRRFTNMRDSLQVAKNVQQMADMQLKYETAKKDKQIALLNQSEKIKNREIFWVLVSSMVFLVLFVIILFQYFTIKRNSKLVKGNNVLLQKALVKIAHIQSHEVRRPLASIMGLINVIKQDNYEVEQELYHKLETSALDLDEQIRDIIINAEIIDSIKKQKT